MILTPNCEAALTYAARGWHSFPVVWGDKVPATNQGFYDATSDTTILRRWFSWQRRNIGIATELSGLVVIDIDGTAGQAIFDGFLADTALCDGITTTYTVKTRTPHGRHYYFRAPQNFQIKSSTGLLGPGIDVRAAGGYVVAPPSWVDADHKGPSGTYEVLIDAPVAALPNSLGLRLQALQHASQTQPKNPSSSKQLRPETSRTIALLQDQLSHISADCSYELYRRTVWAILSSGWSCAEQIALDWSQTAPDRFDQLTFEALIRYFDPNRSDCPSLGSIYHAARAGGWNG